MENSGLFPSLALSVTELTSLIKKTLMGGFYDLNVEGEISNFRPAASGHWYFTLKDEGAMVNAVMFRGKSSMLGFIPKDGDRVLVTGAIDVYEKRGTYQIICSTMSQAGEGNLRARLEQLKNHYAALGYFDPATKQEIPKDPKRIAVVTSETGAALRDILQVLGRRASGVDVVILPTLVQGDQAATSIAARIRQADKFLLGDVIIVARGGGSLEDLMPFSDPLVIEAIHDCSTPVISAVGHEIDWMLSDYVADLRAPTPSAAAEMVSATLAERQASVRTSWQALGLAMQERLREARIHIRQASPLLLAERISTRIEQYQYQLDDLSQSMRDALEQHVHLSRQTLQALQKQIQVLSPQDILARGYALVSDKDSGKTVSSITEIQQGQALSIHVADGVFDAEARR